MHKYCDGSETPQGKTYQSIMRRLNNFIECLPTEADKQLLSNMISDCYCKYNEAINAKEKDDPSLIMPLVMSLLVDQQLVIDKLKNHRINNEPPL
jgi:hypothetical protein